MARVGRILMLATSIAVSHWLFSAESKAQGFSINIGIGKPKPAIVYAPRSVWIPAHYETVFEQVWVPGCERQVWIEPVYSLRRNWIGRPYYVCVRAGYWQTVCDPGRYETRRRQVWVAGHWQLC